MKFQKLKAEAQQIGVRMLETGMSMTSARILQALGLKSDKVEGPGTIGAQQGEAGLLRTAAAFGIGMALGAGGMLFLAPTSGREMRAKMVGVVRKLMGGSKHLAIEDASDGEVASPLAQAKAHAEADDHGQAPRTGSGRVRSMTGQRSTTRGNGEPMHDGAQHDGATT